MGGRGASSGISVRGNPYGSQYHTLLEVDNIKYVSKNTRQSEDLMETMTPGRVYVTVGGTEPNRITFFDNANMRSKVIEKDKRTGTWHVHSGYYHGENSNQHWEDLTEADQALIDRVIQLWHNH